MSLREIPGHGPTALGLITEAELEFVIPYGAKRIPPQDHFCEVHGECQIVAEFGEIDILSCGCEFDLRG